VQCVICTDYIKYFAIPEVCNHNLICWNCVLKQRLKLNIMACSMCKEESSRVLITHDKTQTIAKQDSRIVEDVINGIVFSNPQVKAEIARKIDFYCQKCEEQAQHANSLVAISRKFPTEESLREHIVKMHRCDFCELCLKHKPVLIFEQPYYKYEALNKHIGKQHPHCFFCTTKYFYDQDKLNVHYRSNHYFCDVCRKLGRKMQARKRHVNLPEYEVYRDQEMLREHCRKNHYVCEFKECQMLVFEDNVVLNEHYNIIHG